MSEQNRGVVILSPSRYSFYTLSVAHGLHRRGYRIDAIIFRKLFNLKRFTSEFHRDGMRLVHKIVDKLILKQRAYRPENYETLLDYMKRNGITPERVDHFARRQGIPTLHCRDFNDAEVIERLKHIQPELVVFTGGGLLRKPLLEASGRGVMNCHSGILPEYRGMDVVEWAVLEGRKDKVGLTAHFMDTGLDTGDILQTFPVTPVPRETLTQLRGRMEPMMCSFFVDAVADTLEKKTIPQPQQISDGRQYFVMHPFIMQYARRKMLQAQD